MKLTKLLASSALLAAIALPEAYKLAVDEEAAKLAATREYQSGQAGSEVVLFDRYTEDREAIGRKLAEIHRLRAAVQGPDGYASWQEAATAERVRRVAAEKALAAIRIGILVEIPATVMVLDSLLPLARETYREFEAALAEYFAWRAQFCDERGELGLRRAALFSECGQQARRGFHRRRGARHQPAGGRGLWAAAKRWAIGSHAEQH